VHFFIFDIVIIFTNTLNITVQKYCFAYMRSQVLVIVTVDSCLLGCVF
jgi:hypothetical protein